MTQYLTSGQYADIPTGLDTSGTDLDGVLARASAWADRICRLPVGGFVDLPLTDTQRVTCNRDGELVYRLPATSVNVPVTLTSVAWGWRRSSLSALTVLDDVDCTRGLVTAPIGGYTGAWYGSLNIGSPPTGGLVWVQTGYTIGWPNTASLPADLQQAVAFLASALIITPDADEAATPFPGAAARSGDVAKQADVDYLDSAERLLRFYARDTP